METTTTPELTSYRANCHCGAVSLTVKIPSLTDHQVMSCNCSICMRNGYLLVYPDPSNVIFHSGYDHLRGYLFGEKRITHKFCPTCGSGVLAQAIFGGNRVYISVNVRMFQGVDLKALKLRYGNWRAEGWQYVVPQRPELPPASSTDPVTAQTVVSNLTPYYANCHCTAVTYAFSLTEPSLAQCKVVDCNCSICTRNGYLLVYPERKEVVFFTGYDGLLSYEFGEKKMSHKFCPTCGSSILIDFHGRAPRDGVDRLAINVRMLQDINPKELDYDHVDGKTLEPEYTVVS